ncbi:MAG: four helix bundle protein [Nitrospirae bacterium CG18_big_fil_WC_8_21_14_2_50_70_55]|jgi:four helix bundle protein|nr:four helix bundle protein [Deltaproteobacteria bacterium]OIP66794.1 MAG: four helix bundle protein [Nitrospirae bacterium CG2_30_70_394]PIQ03446.1 MAG: four helix bundle protein [Nitrospirae bacterium CG18_big_fil_WC_8_21_14_2_50_70_55]PIU78657.1 MAG: four helix bundle protein [Nitrospirae bacterium CG06_land_8_20_14_3_00_70_43]PIW83305.1 MAG: four helix bundle protein [Nitrospirae bacterium CG_4_8_14_3_um_filter_70_85]PIX83705.1 MAG: four helix bundle protein [Nitrospirae bacterium CG_4_10
MEKIQRFEQLIAWQKAHAFVLEIYRITRDFPREEMYGMTNQLRRAAVSAPANIAEGFKRRSPQEKARFYNIAQASLEEARYYLILAGDLEFVVVPQALTNLADEVARLLSGLVTSVNDSQ